MATAGQIPEAQWKDSPGATAWSAGEVFAHLKMVEDRVMGRAMKLAGGTPENVPFFKRFHVPVQLAALRAIKRKSPIPIDRALVTEKSVAFENLAAARSATIQLIESTEGRDLSGYRFTHPFLGSLNFYEWCRFLGYQELRHAKQIREIAKSFQQ